MDSDATPKFGGEPGEPVPEVDPADVKTIWKMQREVQADHPGEQVAISSTLFERACTPGANIHAASYRTSQLFLISLIAPELWSALTDTGQPRDSVFAAISTIPMEWMGVGVERQGPPFDFKEFLRRCESH